MKQCADLLCPCVGCCTVCARLDVLKMSQCLFGIFATVFMLLGCTDDIYAKEQHHCLSCLTAYEVYTCTFIFLFANSVSLAFILDWPSLCKIRNLPLHLLRCRFYMMWNSMCYYTRIVCVPAYTFEQALKSCFFINILSPPPGLLATCNQYWSPDWYSYALLHYSTFFLWWIQTWNATS